MRIFIAARGKDQLKARRLANTLNDSDLDIQVTSTWVYEVPADRQGLAGGEYEQLCIRDFRDIAKSDCLLVYPSLVSSRNDACPEMFGAALAFGKRIVVIGEPRTPFHHLPIVEVYADIESFIEHLKNEE